MDGFRSQLVECRLMISFKGAQYPKDVILFAVFFYVRYDVPYVSVRFPRSDGVMECLIVFPIDSGHLGVFYGWQEGPEEAFLV